MSATAAKFATGIHTANFHNVYIHPILWIVPIIVALGTHCGLSKRRESLS